MANPKRASMREGPARGAVPQDRRGRGAARAQSAGAAARGADAPAASSRRAPGPPARDRPAAPRAERQPAGRPSQEVHVPSPAGAAAPRLLLGDPRERDGAPGAAAPAAADYGREHRRPRRERRTPVGQPVIRVVGVGGAGVNAVNRMVEAEVEGVEFLAVNTDLQSLQQSTADLTLHIGAELTRGLGSGSDSNVGRQAAMEDYDRMKALLKGSDMIFIAAGSGGGTGTGAAPVVARIAREVGALTVGIVTKPFGFEGTRRSEQGERGVDRARAGGRHADRRPQRPAAVGARQADLDGRRVPRRRRRAAPGRPGRLRPRDPARPDQPRLRRRAHDHERRRQRAARHRHGRGREPRDRGRDAGRLLAAAGNLDGGRPLDPAVDHRRRRTCRCGRSTRPPSRSPRPRIPTPTSSSARWSTRSSTTRSG